MSPFWPLGPCSCCAEGPAACAAPQPGGDGLPTGQYSPKWKRGLYSRLERVSPCPPETGSPGVCLLAALAVCADGTGTGAALLEAGVQRPGARAPEPRQVPVPAAAAGRPGRQRRGADRVHFSRTRTAAQNSSCRRRFASMEESSFNTISPGQLKRNTGWFPAEVALRGVAAPIGRLEQNAGAVGSSYLRE